MVTIKDVAKEAGVSASTVSYYLKGGESVSSHTARKIRTAVKKLGYTRNTSAQSLRYGKTYAISIGVHELDIPYFFSKFNSVAIPIVEEKGYRGNVFQTGIKASSVEKALRRISDQPCDGLILGSTKLPVRRIIEISKNKPTVLLDDCSREPILDTVNTANSEGAYVAVSHLIGLGCSNIAMIGVDLRKTAHEDSDPTIQSLRCMGAMKALRESGLPVYESLIINSRNLSVDEGLSAAHRLVKAHVPFDGLFCASDAVAFGAIRGLVDCGYSVPADVKVIGMDGISLNPYAIPSISSVEIDMHDFAEKTVDMLISRISGEYQGPARRVNARYSLVERESTQTAGR
ncbi:LacI family DNA-binding transcriptional regulator [Bifidobacterium olomucense]|uniref:Periplasmic binding protein and sugar binding domain of the LacI family protein n=1 Tax=Bifidobacterium olomucense TaxID=2675324 RepID=A0A7Y0EX97_9BIFI|nr:LacI family DNA-binding transcriptional regulator [Bifidobacterium sp. DSM 109959]NMM98064.1 periplasmic binding protein and sugar binding domain of the LacI family protein [Bifidobacterium sp. DSM 109959]